jgi:hypothetical protein
MPYEVDTADGRCLYRGHDLGLACEIHDQVPTAVLLTLPSSRPTHSGSRTRAPWKGPAVARRPGPTARVPATGWAAGALLAS